jgi:ribosome-associated heat shock protein Hsp15
MTQECIRIDKWLWFARVVKTRTLAQKIVRAGKIRANKQKILNPAKLVAVDDVLTITLERQILIFKIVECGSKRGPFIEAEKLYQDLTPIPDKAEQTDAKGEKHVREKVPKPDKFNRRKLIAFKNRQYFQ